MTETESRVSSISKESVQYNGLRNHLPVGYYGQSGRERSLQRLSVRPLQRTRRLLQLLSCHLQRPPGPLHPLQLAQSKCRKYVTSLVDAGR